jgi:hypothetical protein
MTDWGVSRTVTVYGWVLLVQQGFEGTFPSGSWIRGAESGFDTAAWEDVNKRAYEGSWSAHCAAYGNSDWSTTNVHYHNNMQTWMEYQNLNLSGYNVAKITFKLWRNLESNYDWVTIFLKDSSGNWHNMKAPSYQNVMPSSSNPYGYTGNTQSWTQYEVDLSTYAYGTVNIQILFKSDATFVPTGESGAYIDDIRIYGLSD